MTDRCVLAYSGGLDTSVAIGWLKDKYGAEVIAMAVDVGQGVDEDLLHARGEACGASEVIVVDAREEFARDFALPALRANALYMGKYPLVSALSRPLIVKHLVRIAREKEAKYVAHGCTGKGNDQVRFEVATAALAPDLVTLAPVRDAGLTRDAAIEYAEERSLPVPVTKSSPYSIDENLWGRTIECGVIEDPWVSPPQDAYEWTVAPENAPDEPDVLTISFESGSPVTIDGVGGSAFDLIAQVARRAGAHGIGRIDMIEDRLIGIKSREVYEVPGAVTLITAHRDLEDLTLERSLASFKRGMEPVYADLVYNGLWYSPLRRALDAFIADSQRPVTGDVRMRLYRGAATVEGRRAPQALYEHGLATYEAGDRFDHDAAAGFVKLWGLPLKVWSERQGEGR
ncbi:MAG: argininosuccinate synthase [Actinobacteria bacterium]|nr:MAG: argininosuccinate synthase [Actinomycetota bacterium]